MNVLFRHRAGGVAFTLVEVLVAIAVLSIMLLFLATFLTSVGVVSSVGQQNAENSSDARAILDLLSRELQAGVNRPDLTTWITWASSPPTLTFYSRSTGSAIAGATTPGNYRGLSYVEYSLIQTSTTSFLERGDQAVLWTDTPSSSPPNNSIPLGYAAPTAPAPALSDVLDGVVAFQVTFLQQGRTYSSTYSSTTTIAAGLSLALVDSKSFKTLVSTGKLSALSTALTSAASAASSSTSPKTAWESAVASGTLSGYPQQVKTGLLFFERFVDLPKPAL